MENMLENAANQLSKFTKKNLMMGEKCMTPMVKSNFKLKC